MDDDVHLRGDCSRCIGLCCVALSFERGPHFGFDKLAGETCRHLGADHRCRIHHRLASAGMSGCVRYDCLGAGQLVTAMFAGLTPQRSAAVGRAMTLAFARAREVQVLRRVLGKAPGRDAQVLDSRLEAATASYPALLQLDLAHARRAASAIVLAAGRPS